MQVVNIQQYSDFASQKMVKHNLFTSERMFCDVYCLEPAQFQPSSSVSIHTQAPTRSTTSLKAPQRLRLTANGKSWAPDKQFGRQRAQTTVS